MMTGNEFSSMCDLLGLTPQFFSQQCQVDLRTVLDWQDGDVSVPEEIAFLVETLNERVEETVAAGAERVKNLPSHEKQTHTIYLAAYRSDQELWRFRDDLTGLPATFHRRMVERTKEALEQEGVAVHISTMNQQQYDKWLAGREDTDELRSLWLRMKCSKTS